jgi:hypothetical protein
MEPQHTHNARSRAQHASLARANELRILFRIHFRNLSDAQSKRVQEAGTSTKTFIQKAVAVGDKPKPCCPLHIKAHAKKHIQVSSSFSSVFCDASTSLAFHSFLLTQAKRETSVRIKLCNPCYHDLPVTLKVRYRRINTNTHQIHLLLRASPTTVRTSRPPLGVGNRAPFVTPIISPCLCLCDHARSWTPRRRSSSSWRGSGPAPPAGPSGTTSSCGGPSTSRRATAASSRCVCVFTCTRVCVCCVCVRQSAPMRADVCCVLSFWT